MKLLLSALVPLVTVACLILWCAQAYRCIAFTRGCSGHLNRAAAANDVNMAAEELDAAIAYAERHGNTRGYTSILYTTPEEDVGFWYRNLVAARRNIAELPPGDSSLERTNLLLKLHETLSHDPPEGTRFHPYNVTFAVLNVLSALAVFGTAALFFNALE